MIRIHDMNHRDYKNNVIQVKLTVPWFQILGPHKFHGPRFPQMLEHSPFHNHRVEANIYLPNTSKQFNQTKPIYLKSLQFENILQLIWQYIYFKWFYRKFIISKPDWTYTMNREFLDDYEKDEICKIVRWRSRPKVMTVRL